MKRKQLNVEKRTVFGKKVKKLRNQGMLPGNIYGKDIESTAVQVQTKELESMYKESGETGLTDLLLDGQLRPVLIHHIERHPVTHLPLHADFYQVNLKEKVKTMIPLVIVGEPKAVFEKLGLLLQPLSEIEVEALPEKLPEHIEIAVEHLAAVDDQITVGELKLPTDIEVLTDKDQVVVKIAELVTKEAQEQAAQEAAAAAEAKEEAGAEEGQGVATETLSEQQEAPAEKKEE